LIDADSPGWDAGDQPFGESGAQHGSSNIPWRLGGQHLWLFWVAPILGGILGGGAYRFLMEE